MANAGAVNLEPTAPTPPYDQDLLERFLDLAITSEDGWRKWFELHRIAPMEIVYEDMDRDLDAAVRRALQFLEIDYPADAPRIEPGLRRQADASSDAIVTRVRQSIASSPSL